MQRVRNVTLIRLFPNNRYWNISSVLSKYFISSRLHCKSVIPSINMHIVQ
jgi:hypothetical protein